MLNGSYSPKSLYKLVLPKNGFISNFFEAKIFEKCPNVIFRAILAILGPYDPLKSPLHYQQSMLNGSYSPKSLYKLVLSENGFISNFFEAKIFEKCQNVILHAILANFGTI